MGRYINQIWIKMRKFSLKNTLETIDRRMEAIVLSLNVLGIS